MNFKQVISNFTKRNNINNNNVDNGSNNIQNNEEDTRYANKLNKRKRSDFSNRKIRSPSPTRRNHTNHFQFSTQTINKNNSIKANNIYKSKIDLTNLNTNLKLDYIENISKKHSADNDYNIDNDRYNTNDNYKFDTNNPFITPPSSAIELNYDKNQPPPKNLVFTKLRHNENTKLTKNELVNNFASLKIINNSHKIFQIPEILNRILKNIVQLEQVENESLEIKYTQRLPDSYNHALLIYKDEKIAKKVWNEIVTKKNSQSIQCQNKNVSGQSIGNIKGNIFNCLMVNKLWFNTLYPILLNELYFNSSKRFNQFCQQSKFLKLNYCNTHESGSNYLNITSLKLNRIYDPINLNESTPCFQHLIKLNIHICPSLNISANWFAHMNNLKELSITGSKKIDNNFLIDLSKNCSSIVNLDLRACEKVGDTGIVAIAINCPNLKLINLGRHNNGSNITDISLVALAKFTKVETVGLAGCNITDTGLWEFAKNNGINVRRLSLNNCNKLTDFSIPYLLGFNYLPNLSVLEIKFLEKLNNVKYIAKFKLWRQSLNKPILIETCERITKLINIEEQKIRKHNARVCIREMTNWVNGNDAETLA